MDTYSVAKNIVLVIEEQQLRISCRLGPKTCNQCLLTLAAEIQSQLNGLVWADRAEQAKIRLGIPESQYGPNTQGDSSEAERRSPKPLGEGSSPSHPANYYTQFMCTCKHHRNWDNPWCAECHGEMEIINNYPYGTYWICRDCQYVDEEFVG